jgi:uncharacterized repeat protein (TIGR01451 family)
MGYKTLRALLVIFVLPLIALTGCTTVEECDHDSALMEARQARMDAEQALKAAQEALAVANAKQGPAPAAAAPSDGTRYTDCSSPGRITQAFPTGVRSSSVILVEKEGPEVVTLGAPFTYKIHVTNLTNCDIIEVVLTDQFAKCFKFASASMQPQMGAGGKATWNIGTIPANETKTIEVNGSASCKDLIVNCSTISYKRIVCLEIAVISPALTLTKRAPAKVTLCEEIPLNLTVKNTGTGTAKNVKITDNLPSGLMTKSGDSSITIDVGDLPEGESKSYDIVLKASKGGTYKNTASVTGAGNLKADATTTTQVVEPRLKITKKGIDKLYVGNKITYEISVENVGDGASENTTIIDQIPSGLNFLSASDGGANAGSNVSWSIGTLPPGGKKTVTLTCEATQITKVTNVARVKGDCASEVSASVESNLLGIPAVLLEVIDLDDPVRVGTNVIYEITATNQGSAPGTNITIVCTLENTAKFVKAEGPTGATQSGQTISFAPVPSLAPKDKATWRVEVQAVKAADVRFAVQMDTDQITRPVNETEATNFYE